MKLGLLRLFYVALLLDATVAEPQHQSSLYTLRRRNRSASSGRRGRSVRGEQDPVGQKELPPSLEGTSLEASSSSSLATIRRLDPLENIFKNCVGKAGKSGGEGGKASKDGGKGGKDGKGWGPVGKDGKDGRHWTKKHESGCWEDSDDETNVEDDDGSEMEGTNQSLDVNLTYPEYVPSGSNDLDRDDPILRRRRATSIERGVEGVHAKKARRRTSMEKEIHRTRAVSEEEIMKHRELAKESCGGKSGGKAGGKGSYGKAGSSKGGNSSGKASSGKGGYSSNKSGSGKGSHSSGKAASGKGGYSYGKSGSGKGNHSSGKASSGKGGYSYGKSGSGKGNYSLGKASSGKGGYSSTKSGSGKGNHSSGKASSGKGGYSYGKSGSDKGDYSSGKASSGKGGYSYGKSGSDKGDYSSGKASSGKGGYSYGKSGSGKGNYSSGKASSGKSGSSSSKSGSGKGGYYTGKASFEHNDYFSGETSPAYSDYSTGTASSSRLDDTAAEDGYSGKGNDRRADRRRLSGFCACDSTGCWEYGNNFDDVVCCDPLDDDDYNDDDDGIDTVPPVDGPVPSNDFPDEVDFPETVHVDSYGTDETGFETVFIPGHENLPSNDLDQMEGGF